MGLETALLVFQAASAVKGFVDQRSARKDAKKANRAAAEQAQKEARLTREDGEQRALEELRDAKRIRSAQLASFLSSGVTLDGSPLLVADETKTRGEQNAENIRRNADADAESIIFNAEANKQVVQKEDIFGTAGTVLGAAKGIKDANKKK